MTVLILPYGGTSPEFAAPIAHAGTGAAVLGRATLGRNAWLGALSVIRADGHFVAIGDDFRLGARSTVHIAHDVFPTKIGSNVTAGSNTVIHACEVGDDCHLGNNVVVLDGSKLAAGCALGDGAVVFPRAELEGGWYYEGVPASPVRRLEKGELEKLHAATRALKDEAIAETGLPTAPEGATFVAATARLAGRVATQGENGIWFGCDLDAGEYEIRIGANTNIQDNTVMRCERSSIVIGRDSTVGHNVEMRDCTIGDRSLIGIGAVVAPGTKIGNDVLLAAGARTQPGQVLDDGWLYTGSPARRRAPLDDAKRMMIAENWPTYCEYARRFAEVQQKMLKENRDPQPVASSG